MLDNRDALLFIRGERPLVDRKYDLMKHPNIKATEDGGAPPYHKPVQEVRFAKSDLSHPVSPDDIEIIE